ncbi:GMC oxidoreductase [Nocardia asteroides]|uniref:GMC oxidoreductase n=1 Tax=Nocardia asteroides TaxID=1824 RepID=UPI001E5F97D2|nr:GMC oxidoreductase [Nocardia asteroides]UGT61417.1 GMC family oxidoreductase [Nocardia asteroides]
MIKSFYSYDENGMRSKGGKFALYDSGAVEIPHRRKEHLELAGANVDSFLKQEARGFTCVKVSYKGESNVSDEKFLTMAGGKTFIHYRPHDQDLRRQEAVAKQLELISDTLGLRSVCIQPVPSGASLVSAHHHGGAIATQNDSDSVLAADNQVIEAPGVYVADASSMPTSGGTNSSLTVMAIARRLSTTVLTMLKES